MKTKQEIEEGLAYFHGSEMWIRFSPLFPKVLLTEGAHYVAEECGAYWLMDVIASHVMRISDTFALIKFVRTGSRGVVTLADDDPPTETYATQEIDFTDFPLDEIKLYAIFDGDMWVILLPGEY